MLLAANFERFRQSARSEIDSQKGYGKVAAVRALLPFAERFTELQCERKTGEECDADDEIHKYYGGIYKQYTQLLDSWKVTEYTVSPGDKFDINCNPKNLGFIWAGPQKDELIKARASNTADRAVCSKSNFSSAK